MRALVGATLSWLVIALASCGGSRSEPVRVRVHGVELVVTIEPADPRVGENAMWVELRDASGAPIAGADLAVAVTMHAMGAMPAMGGPARVTEVAKGRYRADFALDMGGSWNVALAVKSSGAAIARAEGSLTVGTPGVRIAGAASEAPGEASASDPAHPAEFSIEPGRVQRIGVKIAPAERKPLIATVRAVGRVVSEEATLTDVSLKVNGWVAEIRADSIGAAVQRGDVLFGVYSPDLYAAQQEYLQALRSQQRARDTAAPDRADYLVRAAHNRLRLWDIAEADLERLAERGEPFPHLPIRAPVTGYLVEKNLVEGSAFAAGDRLYRIAPLARVWIEAEIYESELALVREGQRATIALPYAGERTFEATVAYVYPTLDPKTRTARVRLALANPDLALRPDMYANVRLEADRGERLVVPQSAVLYAGDRSFVFRALGDGRFRPQRVEVGLRTGEEVEIRSGLEPGDAIVTSATFLIASESRLRAALEQW